MQRGVRGLDFILFIFLALLPSFCLEISLSFTRPDQRPKIRRLWHLLPTRSSMDECSPRIMIHPADRPDAQRIGLGKFAKSRPAGRSRNLPRPLHVESGACAPNPPWTG
ncbi:hypothetical protein AAHC03_024385 [Spirometra sp. Aus1]